MNEEVDESAVEEESSAPKDPNAKVPFLKNWVFWTSLSAAIPAGFLAVSIVRGAMNNGGQFNWLMALVAGTTFLCSGFLTVLPLLIGLGFFMGGKDIVVEVPDTDTGGGDSEFDGFDDDGFDGESSDGDMFDSGDDFDYDEGEDDDF